MSKMIITGHDKLVLENETEYRFECPKCGKGLWVCVGDIAPECACDEPQSIGGSVTINLLDEKNQYHERTLVEGDYISIGEYNRMEIRSIDLPINKKWKLSVKIVDYIFP